MIFGSVCSGIEAASAAWHPLGWRAAFLSEIERYPCALLQARYPDVPNLGDMTNYRNWPDATVDVLAGGTPCQSYSVAGLRAGLSDPRGALMLTYGAIAGRYRPRWCVWENVPGVLSSNGGRDFGTFLGMLGELGYGFAYRVLDAQFFGVAQRRRRVLVVGRLGNWRAAAAVLFDAESLRGNPAPSREAWQTVAGTLTAGSGRRGGAPTTDDVTANKLIVLAHGQAGAEVDFDRSPTLTTLHEAPIIAFDCKASGSRGMSVGDVAPTMRAQGASSGDCNVALSDGTQVRRLTPRECERLQGFADDYTLVPYTGGKPAKDAPRYRALGNSMAVPVMRWLGERIGRVESALSRGHAVA